MVPLGPKLLFNTSCRPLAAEIFNCKACAARAISAFGFKSLTADILMASVWSLVARFLECAHYIEVNAWSVTRYTIRSAIRNLQRSTSMDDQHLFGRVRDQPIWRLYYYWTSVYGTVAQFTVCPYMKCVKGTVKFSRVSTYFPSQTTVRR